MFDNLKVQMTNLIQQSTVNQVQRNANQPLSIHTVSASNRSITSEHSNQSASVQSKQNTHTSPFAFSNPTLLPHLTLACQNQTCSTKLVLWKDGETAFIKDSACCSDEALANPHSVSTVTILALSIVDPPSHEVISDDSDDDHP